jgi:hypothetical protein
VSAIVDRLRLLCTGDPEGTRRAFASNRSWPWFSLAVIVAGSGVYGAMIGLGRAPLQAAYTALKFPLLILLTTAGNALLNGMLAQLLGLGISFRQSTLAIVTSFAVASTVLASLSPVAFFLWWNTPPFTSPHAVVAHNATLVTHVALIAFAGAAGNAALYRLLALLSGSRAVAGRILAAWLLGNMFLGCQLSWIMRPFIGAPTLPVEFFRADAFRGNFYEATFRALANLMR